MRRAILCCTLVFVTFAQKPRARDLGVPFTGTPGKWNAITDVAGVEVGYSTILEGSARTGVTAIWPRGKSSFDTTFAGWFSQNGNGEMTGTAWIEESGEMEGPVMITNTHSVGTVRDEFIRWQIDRMKKAGRDTAFLWSLPVVAETWDGYLSDINGFHVKPKHTVEALESAAAGPVAEGNVGGGTGMVCFEFKGGSGTASRTAGDYRVGAFVQCNCGRRKQLTIAGVPVGLEIPGSIYPVRPEAGSIIIVIGTDAPLLPHQLKRLARRATMGLARLGATSGNGSGDLFLAFSTGGPGAPGALRQVSMLDNASLDPLFDATVQATEEAIVNAMVAAETMTGIENRTVPRLPHDRLRQALRKFGR